METDRKLQIAEKKLEAFPDEVSLSSRVEEIHAQLMREVTEDEKDYYSSYLHLAKVTAMAVAVCEKLCGDLSGSDPSEWVREQLSREGNTRSKEDPRLKAFHSYLQLAGQLIGKGLDFRWRLT